MVALMFARFPHSSEGDSDRQADKPRRLDWHSLLAKLEAERDLRSSFGASLGTRSLAQLMADGSFDPQAAEMLFSLAASVGPSGDMPERRFSPEDLARLSHAITDGSACLPNPKSSPAREAYEVTALAVGIDGPGVGSATRKAQQRERVEDQMTEDRE
jgi:hypothetical protein